MRIVVLSDTHMPLMSRVLPPPLEKALRKADAIIHAGDWTDPRMVDLIAEYAPLESVAGNNDGPEIVNRFGFRKILTYEEVRIGLVHGHGEGKRMDTQTRAVNAFAGEPVDGIVFGHSHIPVLVERDGVLLFNPGSPTDKRGQAQYSFGILDIEGSQMKARHLFYREKR